MDGSRTLGTAQGWVEILTSVRFMLRRRGPVTHGWHQARWAPEQVRHRDRKIWNLYSGEIGSRTLMYPSVFRIEQFHTNTASSTNCFMLTVLKIRVIRLLSLVSLVHTFLYYEEHFLYFIMPSAQCLALVRYRRQESALIVRGRFKWKP